jgi:DNA/RNA endonuclease G (NUC1)
MKPTAVSARWRPLPAAGLALLALLSAAACTDRVPLAPATPEPETPAGAARLDCAVDVRAGSVSCGAPGTAGGGARRAVVGGQGVLVRLASANLQTDAVAGTVSVDVTVQNLMDQAMGTRDGINPAPEGVRVFFHSGPTVTEGTGQVTVANPTGTADFTGSVQPYFQYGQVIAPNAVSAPLAWVWNVPATVDRFVFSVYVAAPLAPRLVISEIMANPLVVDDSVGEYIEIANTGRDPVDLVGWRIASRSGSSTESHTIASSVVVPAGGFVVIAARANPLRNGGVTAAYEWGGTAIQLSNSTSATQPDFVALRRPAASGTAPALDSVVWATGGATTAPPNGRTRELLDLSADNTVMSGPAWSTGYRKYGTGDGTGEYDRGTPGEANAPAVAVGPVATVRISPGFAVVDTVGQFRRFSAFPEDTLGQPASTTITWSSTNPAVATIDNTGLVTQVDTGRTVIVATAANGVSRSTVYGIFRYSPAAVYRNHVEFGIPTPGGSNNDILILPGQRTQYALSYNASRGGPNWVSWNLNRTHFGRVARAPSFYTDPLLPSYGVYQVTTNDYLNSGLTRGHMTQSEQRTQTRADNDTTFLMSNILPQTNDLNTGPWQDLEDYTNDLARFSQKELYNIAGGIYPASPQTLKNEGKVAIPSSTWKIVVVLPYGKGLADVTSASDIEVIVVNMPNVNGIQGQPWTAYRTTVDALEAATGYDFLSALPDAIEAEVEAR